MRPKPAPAMPTSWLAPQHVYLEPDRPARLRCPWCEQWFSLKRKMLPAHNHSARYGTATVRCPGSAQLFELEPICEWVSRYEAGMAEVAPRRAGAFGPKGRRQGRVMPKPAPPVAPPLHRMAVTNSGKTSAESRVLLSVEEAAHRMNVDRLTLYTRIKTGDLETVKVGNRRLVSADSAAH